MSSTRLIRSLGRHSRTSPHRFTDRLATIAPRRAAIKEEVPLNLLPFHAFRVKKRQTIDFPHPYHSSPNPPHPAVMDEHDFDQILQTDFHPNTAPPPHLTEPPSAQHQQEHDTQTQELSQSQDVEDSIDPYDAQQQAFLHDSDDRYESQSPQQREREKVPTASLDAVDKKQRQREQNRVAALRSRSKKNGK
jgi:hypothetical protein